MAKRNTVGQPKRRDRVTQQEVGEGDRNLLSRLLGDGEYENRAERESRLQRIIVMGVIALIAFFVLLIGGGILWQQVLAPRQTVAVVNGESVSIAEFQERTRLERLIINQRFYTDIPFLVNAGLIQNVDQILQQEPYATYWSEITSQPELLGSRVLDDLINETIVEQEAAELGVTVDEAAVDEEVENFFNIFNDGDDAAATEEATEEVTPTVTPTPFVSPTPSPVPTDTPQPTPTPLTTEEATAEALPADVTPTVTPRPTLIPTETPSVEEQQASFEEDIDVFYSDARTEANLNREAVRNYFRYQALLRNLRDTVTEDVTQSAPFVNVRHILVETEEEAQQVVAALQNGESFADLAVAVSTDTGSGSRGGELGWSAASAYVPEFRDAVINADIGAITEPVESEFGFHIIQVRAREDRELSDTEFERAKDTAFQEWLEEVTSDENNDVDRRDNWPSFVPEEPVFDPSRVVDENGNPL